MKNKNYYSELASKIDLPNRNFINGCYVSSKEGRTIPTVNPATGEVLTEISASNAQDVEYAVDVAYSTYKSGVWSKMHPSDRKAVLVKFSNLILRDLDALAVLESLDSGKPIKDCINVDVPETAKCIAWHAELQDKIYEQLSPSGVDAVGMIIHEPIGVVGAVLPWNFPLLMAAWKIGPALATGNSVVVKPSELTSMSTLKLAELATEAGIPDGVFNVVTGSGADVGMPLGLHDKVNAITFTGSTATGRKFLEYSAQSNMKKVVLETGGKSPCVVLADADLENVAKEQAYSFMGNMGQVCTANTRLIVHSSVKEQLLSLLVKECSSWLIGDPLDPSTDLGPLVNRGHYEKVSSLIQSGSEEGAVSLPIDISLPAENTGCFLKPVIFDQVKRSMTVCAEEIFGPVLCVQTFETDEEAIELANDTEYGLAASLYTQNVSKAHRLSREIEAGTVSVNCYSEGDASTPFGGYKMSGFGGKDNGIQAHEQYTEQKTIWIDLTK